MSINWTITSCEWVLSHDSLLQIDEHVLAAQIFSFVAASPADLKKLKRRRILQIITPTDWHVEGRMEGRHAWASRTERCSAK